MEGKRIFGFLKRGILNGKKYFCAKKVIFLRIKYLLFKFTVKLWLI